MKFSRYNYLAFSPKYGNLLFNTRTKFFTILNDEVFHALKDISTLNDFENNAIALSDEIITQLLQAKVLVHHNEDDDYYEIKKFLRYRQTFSNGTMGLVLVPTFTCNFKCPYCYENNLPKNTMSEVIIDRIISFIKRKNQTQIDLCWHGGEPLLAFDKIKLFLDKIEKEHDLSLRFHAMVSNGYLLDDEKCKILHDHRLNQIQITIDGNRATHDMSRVHKSGYPTYDIILGNIDNIFKTMPECHVVIRVNLHEHNKQSFPSLYKELQERWKGEKYSIDLSFAENLNKGCHVTCLEAKTKASYIRDLYEKYEIDDLEFSSYPSIGGCTATYVNSFVIGTSGEIYKCWIDVGKEDRIVGNIFNDKVSPYLMASYSVGSDMFSDVKCKDCFYMPICDGGCTVRRYENKHNGIAYNPCPIDSKEFLSLLELKYMKLINKKPMKIH